MEKINLKEEIINYLVEEKAENIVCLDMKNKCFFTDEFIICTSKSQVHGKAIANQIMKKVGEKKIAIKSTEGFQVAKWILIDFYDIMLHIFTEEQRTYYNIENLWQYKEGEI